jgi:hypothetical protein
MKTPITLSSIIRPRLAQIGLSKIPPAALSYMEECLADDLRRIAANRISSRYVVHTILKALAREQHNDIPF